MQAVVKLEKKDIIKWLITAVVPLLCLLLPVNEKFTSDMRLWLAITLCAILLFGFELVDILVGSMVLMLAYVYSGLSTWQVVFSGFSSNVIYQMLGCFILVGGLMETGALQRISYFALSRFKQTYAGLIWASFAFGFLLSLVTFSASYVVLGLFLLGIVKALDVFGTKAMTGISLAAATGFLSMRGFYYTPIYNAVLVQQATEYLGDDMPLNAATQFIANWPYAIPMFIMMFYLIKFTKPDNELKSKEFFLSEYHKLGKASSREIKSLVILVICIFCLLASSFLNFDGTIVLICLPWIFFLPGFQLVSGHYLKTELPFGVFFFVVACMSMGTVATNLGIGVLFTDLVMPILSNLNAYWFTIVCYLLGVCLNFVMTPFGFHGLVTQPLLQICDSMGYSPELVIYALLHGGDNILFPYEYTPYVALYGFGIFRMNDFMKFMGVKMVLLIVCFAVLLCPWWMILGIL